MEKHYISDTGNRNLQDDLNDFLALLPTDQIVEVALDYLANDQEVQEFVVYIQSDEFHGIVTTVEALDEFKVVSAFMCMLFKPQPDRENVCSVSTGG